MNQTITIDGESYEVDRTVAGAIHEAAEEIETLRSVLRRLMAVVGGEPCWCQCDGGKHSRACRDARQLKIWPRRKNGKPVVEAPSIRHPAGEKYAATYRQMDELPAGEWLSVPFNAEREAFNFRLACVKHRTRSIEAKQRGKKVFARNRVCALALAEKES